MTELLASGNAFGAAVWIVFLLFVALVVGIWRVGSAAKRRERRESQRDREERERPKPKD
jgi:flagellar biosynthesis/type III secretory pathway M-ring protein FliF/YscJ